MNNDDWKSIALPIGLDLLGQPSKQNEHEVRWGTHGSWKLDLDSGTFHSFELGEGGGVSFLLRHFNQDIPETLKRYGHGDSGGNSFKTVGLSPKKATATPPKPVKTFPREQLAKLWQEAAIKLNYSDTFIVLRFPDGHPMSRQKYIPFTKVNDGTFAMRRPEGKLPIYYESAYKDKPLLITEGEKALVGAKAIYDYDTCCHHGGVNSWENCDWSPIFGRDIWIFPDNDEVGKKFALDLEKHLKSNGCKVHIIKPCKAMKEKDDLYDAMEQKMFKDSDDFEIYAAQNPLPKPKGSLHYELAADIMQQVDNPDWLIKNVCERSSVLSIFGAPKSGKSFVAIAMAASITRGADFYGYEAYKAPVVYQVGEGVRGVKRRLAAYQQAIGGLEGAPLLLSNRGTRIIDDAEYELLLESLKEIELQYGSIGMIIFDTLNRNYGGNENDTSDMSLFISRLDSLVHRFGACVAVVHHTGHGNSKRARGSSVLQASLDYEFFVERENVGDDMFVTMQQTLNKDGMGMSQLDFKFQEVDLMGFDDLTSGYLQLTMEKPKQVKYTAAQENTLKALKDAAIKINSEDPVSVWLQASNLVGLMIEDGKELHKKTIQSRLNALKDKGLVHYEENKGYQSKEFDNENLF